MYINCITLFFVVVALDNQIFLILQLFRHGARTYSEIEAKIPMPDYIDQKLIDDYDYQQLTNVN